MSEKDGWWEEVDFWWMRDWPLEDSREEYERLNDVAPPNHKYVPVYCAEPRVKLLKWVSNDD